MKIRLRLNQSGMRRLMEILKTKAIATELEALAEPEPPKKRGKKIAAKQR